MITTDPFGDWDAMLDCPVCAGDLYTEIHSHLKDALKASEEIPKWQDQCPHCLSTFTIELHQDCTGFLDIRNSGQQYLVSSCGLKPGNVYY